MLGPQAGCFAEVAAKHGSAVRPRFAFVQACFAVLPQRPKHLLVSLRREDMRQ